MALSYDVENRMTYANTTIWATKYAYDGQNKRVFSCPYDATQGVCSPTQTFHFYGPNGKVLTMFSPQYTAAYTCSNQICPPTLTMSAPGTRLYFGSRLLGNEDRLGSHGRYPYGEDRGSNPGDGSVTLPLTRAIRLLGSTTRTSGTTRRGGGGLLRRTRIEAAANWRTR
jgi:hypothetical protein